MMIEQIKHIENLTPIHWFLAYAVLTAKLLIQIARSKGPVKDVFDRNLIFSTLAHALLVPVALIVCTDTYMKNILPINYASAVLIGLNIEFIFLMFEKMNNLIKNKKQ